MIQHKTLLILITLASIVVLIGGLGYVFQNQQQLEETNYRLERTIQSLQETSIASTPTVPAPRPTVVTRPPDADQISQDQAIEVATSYLGGGAVVRVELNDEHGSVVYEVQFQDGSRVYVDAGTGQVVYANLWDFRRDGREHERGSPDGHSDREPSERTLPGD